MVKNAQNSEKFKYFDLELTSEERGLLSIIEFRKPDQKFFNNEELKLKCFNFANSVVKCLDGYSDCIEKICEIIEKVFQKSINNLELQAEDAKILIRVVEKNNKNTASKWHTDDLCIYDDTDYKNAKKCDDLKSSNLHKQVEEVIDICNKHNHIQGQSASINLTGAKTRFSNIDPKNLSDNCKKNLDSCKEQIESYQEEPRDGYGVHFNMGDIENGAIHNAPASNGNERILILVGNKYLDLDNQITRCEDELYSPNNNAHDISDL